MTWRYLLDTNTLSEPVRPVPDPALVKRLRRHEGEVVTAAPVWHELQFGCHLLTPSRRRRAFERYLDEVVLPSVPILPYDAQAARWHASERARLTQAGKTPSFVDGQIAAIARVNNLAVVTANVKDFLAFDGLEVEDWRSRQG